MFRAWALTINDKKAFGKMQIGKNRQMRIGAPRLDREQSALLLLGSVQ